MHNSCREAIALSRCANRRRWNHRELQSTGVPCCSALRPARPLLAASELHKVAPMTGLVGKTFIEERPARQRLLSPDCGLAVQWKTKLCMRVWPVDAALQHGMILLHVHTKTKRTNWKIKKERGQNWVALICAWQHQNPFGQPRLVGPGGTINRRQTELLTNGT